MKENINVLNYINRILSILKGNIENIKKSGNTEELYKQELRIEVLTELKEGFEWGTSSNKSKQTSRILYVAELRRENFDISNHLNQIELYSKIREVIPYIMAVSYKINLEEKHLTENLLTFCEKQIEIIDSSSYKRKISFPSKEEVEEAFKCYTQRIKPNKIPALKVYKQPEVNKKIEELYQIFLGLAH